MNQTILNMKSYDRLLAAIVLSALMLTSVFTYEMSAQNQRIKVTESGHITDKASGETHRRHHATKDGFYRGRQVIAPRTKDKDGE